MKRPLKIKKEGKRGKERKRGKKEREEKKEKKWKREGRETIKQRSKIKEQNKGTRKKEQKYSVRNRNEKNNPADVALFADIYHDIRRARPSGNLAQHHTRRRNNGLCTA